VAISIELIPNFLYITKLLLVSISQRAPLFEVKASFNLLISLLLSVRIVIECLGLANSLKGRGALREADDWRSNSAPDKLSISTKPICLDMDWLARRAFLEAVHSLNFFPEKCCSRSKAMRGLKASGNSTEGCICCNSTVTTDFQETFLIPIGVHAHLWLAENVFQPLKPAMSEIQKACFPHEM